MQVIKEFEDTAGAPDIVSVSLNLWDVLYWGDTSPEDFAGNYIPDEQTQLWLTRADPVFRKLKVRLGALRLCHPGYVLTS